MSTNNVSRPICRQIGDADHDYPSRWSREEMLAGADGFIVEDDRLGEIVECATRVETELGRRRSLGVNPVENQKVINLAIDTHVLQDDVSEELIVIPRIVAPLGMYLARPSGKRSISASNI